MPIFQELQIKTDMCNARCNVFDRQSKSRDYFGNIQCEKSETFLGVGFVFNSKLLNNLKCLRC